MSGPRVGLFWEDGAVFRVEILEDRSNADSLGYKLKILSILQQSPLYRPSEVGEVFDVWAKRNAGCFGGMWHLSENPIDIGASEDGSPK